jgi:hypothetical protein
MAKVDASWPARVAPNSLASIANAPRRKHECAKARNSSEQQKLIAEEGRKLNRDRWLVPLLFLLASLTGGMIAAVCIIPEWARSQICQSIELTIR